MIRELEPAALWAWLPRLAEVPGYGAQMWADANRKLEKQTMPYRFFAVGQACVLGQNLGRASLVGEPEDGEELALFLEAQGTAVLTSGGWAPQRWQAVPCMAMRREAGAAAEAAPPEGFDPEPSMMDVLELLAEGASWPPDARRNTYFNLCVRRNNGGDIVGIRQNGTLVATAGVTVFTPREAFINNVQTLQAARGQGLATALVEALCQKHAAHAKGLLCEQALVGFYQRMGFEEEGRATVARPPAES